MVWQGNYAKLFIGGRWIDPSSDETIEVISPFTEQPVASVPAASENDVDRAVAAAREAFDHGPWPRMTLAERAGVLRRLSQAYRQRCDLLAGLVTTEMGCPISQSQLTQATLPRIILDTFVGLAPQYPFSTVRRSETGSSLVTREPVGVVAAVVPWNAPQNTTMMKLAPALLCGCTVVLKPRRRRR